MNLHPNEVNLIVSSNDDLPHLLRYQQMAVDLGPRYTVALKEQVRRQNGWTQQLKDFGL